MLTGLLGLGASQGHPRAGNYSFAWLECPLLLGVKVQVVMRCLGAGRFPACPGNLGPCWVSLAGENPAGTQPQQDWLSLFSPRMPTPARLSPHPRPHQPGGCVVFFWPVPTEGVQDPPSSPTDLDICHHARGGFGLRAPQGMVLNGSAPSSSARYPGPGAEPDPCVDLSGQDVDNIYHSQDCREFNLLDFSHLESR